MYLPNQISLQLIMSVQTWWSALCVHELFGEWNFTYLKLVLATHLSPARSYCIPSMQKMCLSRAFQWLTVQIGSISWAFLFVTSQHCYNSVYTRLTVAQMSPLMASHSMPWLGVPIQTVSWEDIPIVQNLSKICSGWDTYRSDSVTIKNSVITNGDDCVSFKPSMYWIYYTSPRF
jgi:hypothetical protein